MINNKTVFILGAGASAPYGYPTGAGLKNMICNEHRKLLDLLIPNTANIGVSWEEEQKNLLKKKSVEFIDRFRQSPGDFIDRFLEANANDPHIPETGRKLIALAILKAEKESNFLSDLTDKNKVCDWYKELFNLMNDDCRGCDGYVTFKDNKVDFITFNYDRSLEYFLYKSLTNHYGDIDLRKNRPIDLIPFKFIHVYGKIDNFHWEEPRGLEYRAEYGVRDIIRAADNIKLIHERDNSFLEEIKIIITEAKNIFFLGFGYDKDNLRALGWPDVFNEEKRVFGTALNKSENRINEIRGMMPKGFKGPIVGLVSPVIMPIDCRSLLETFRADLV